MSDIGGGVDGGTGGGKSRRTASKEFADAVVNGAWHPATFLGKIGSSARRTFVEHGIRRRYDAGNLVLREGDETAHVVLLVRGSVKVVAAAENSREALLAIRTAGDLIGELALISSQPRIADVVACGVVHALEVGAASFTRILEGSPEVLTAVNRILAERLQVATRRRIELSGCPVDIRVARLLCELARRYGIRKQSAVEIGVPLTQPELAAAVGAADASVHKALRALRERGIVGTGYRHLTILRLDLLEEIAGLR